MNYAERIQDSIEFIHNDYGTSITLDDLAEKAFCSKYHYLRIFHSMVGESPMDYLRRYRLEKAVYEIMSTKKSITEIAMECGFNSSIVFCRMFKIAFGITPSSYRRNRIPLPEFHELKLTGGKPETYKNSFIFGPRFIEKPEFKVVGMECRITKESNMVNRDGENFWKKFCPLSQNIQNRVDDITSYGMSYPDSASDNFIYMVCVEVTEKGSIPAGMVYKEIPGCKCAVFTIKGEREKIIENFYFTIDYIYGQWLPYSGYELSPEIDLFEYYDERFKCKDNAQMDLYIPIK